ncbi:MAG TPA: hypothetical protein VKQ36_14860, partial [Ktedonobacterales bacterium]|nr:hypothetical protein [Ktedonobacterales bacterium]
GGETWAERPALGEIPSKPTWSFPPRPWTHHVRWIECDPHTPGKLYVAIEQGGVMRSLDDGLTWEDRKPGAEIDGHTLGTHRLAPGLVYEASGGSSPINEDGSEAMIGKAALTDLRGYQPRGFTLQDKAEDAQVAPDIPPRKPPVVLIREGGYAESRDGGTTWETKLDGLNHHYMWSIAADPGDPETLVMSAARGPQHAHVPAMAESFLYRRTKGKHWQMVGEGYAPSQGSVIAVLAAHPGERGVIYAASNRGVYRSNDTGLTWAPLPLDWPDAFQKQHVQWFTVGGA